VGAARGVLVGMLGDFRLSDNWTTAIEVCVGTVRPTRGSRHMHRATRSPIASLSVVACLWPAAVSAEAQGPPSADPSLTIDQVRDAFATAGYEADQPRSWDWTSPPVLDNSAVKL
jgi:hypothetical protein